jgi:VWFA-related protein
MKRALYAVAAGALLSTASGPAALFAKPPVALQERPSAFPAPEFPAGVDVVNVDVVVLDRHGDPIEGLTVDDFKIRDEGRLRAITGFEAVTLAESAPRPPLMRSRVSTNTSPPLRPERTFVIVFDNVHISPERAERAKESVARFLEEGLTDGDRVVLIPTSGGAWWNARMPDGREDVVAALARLQGERPRVLGPDRISDYEAMRLYLHRDQQVGAEVSRRFYENRVILEPPGGAERADLDLGEGHPLIRVKSIEIYQAALSRKQATFKALERAAEALSNAKGRKSILLVSEGFIQEPNLPDFRDVVRAAREASAAIYYIDVRGLGGLPYTADAEYADPTDQRDLNSQLQEGVAEALGSVSLAVDTGGFAMTNSNDFARGMLRIDRASRAYYLVGFSIGGVKRDGKFHELKVEVDRPGARVVARKGYYAPSDEPAPKLPADALDPEIRTAVDSPFDADSIPLRMSSYVLGAEGGEMAVLLTADVDPGGLSLAWNGERYEGTLSTFLLVSSRDTGETWHRERDLELSLPTPLYQQIQERWLPLLRDFRFAPGTYQARLLVRDGPTGRVGTVRHEFEVPAPDSFRVSTPILTDVVQPGEEGAGPRPIPLARQRFQPGGTLYYAFEVFGAQPGISGAPEVQTGYRVESLDGQVIGSQPTAVLPPGPGGTLSQMYALNVTGMTPGHYLIVLQVRDQITGRTLERADSFEIGDPDAGPTPSPPTRSSRSGPT